MAVSIIWRGSFVGVLIITALLFGVCMRTPDFWETPEWLASKEIEQLGGLLPNLGRSTC